MQAQIPPGTYAFAATYNGTRQTQLVTVGTSPQTVYFHTELVDVELQCWPAPGVTTSCGNRGDILAGSASYYAGTWRPISTPDANNPKVVQAEMLPGSYSFAATYDGTRQQQKATIKQPNPNPAASLPSAARPRSDWPRPSP